MVDRFKVGEGDGRSGTRSIMMRVLDLPSEVKVWSLLALATVVAGLSTASQTSAQAYNHGPAVVTLDVHRTPEVDESDRLLEEALIMLRNVSGLPLISTTSQKPHLDEITQALDRLILRLALASGRGESRAIEQATALRETESAIRDRVNESIHALDHVQRTDVIDAKLAYLNSVLAIINATGDHNNSR